MMSYESGRRVVVGGVAIGLIAVAFPSLRLIVVIGVVAVLLVGALGVLGLRVLGPYRTFGEVWHGRPEARAEHESRDG